MDDSRDRLIVEISKLSKNIFLSFFGFGTLYFFSFVLEISWLVAISGVLLLLAVFLLWIMPGIFLLLGKPWLAYAWFRGVNPIVYPKKSWEDLSWGVKTAIFIQSIITSFAILIFLYVSLMNTINK